MEFSELVFLLMIAEVTILFSWFDTKRTIKFIASIFKGAFGKNFEVACDAIAKDGEETRDSLRELDEVITKSHLSTKIELIEMLETMK